MMGPIFKYRVILLRPRIPLFGAMSRDDVDYFISPLSLRRIGPGEILTREGDPPRDFFLILEGEMDLNSGDVQVAKLGEGDLIGAEAPIGIQEHSFTAVAQTTCLVLVIPLSAVHRMSKGRPQGFSLLMNNIARDFARRLQSLVKMIGGSGQNGHPGRSAGRERPARPHPRTGGDLKPEGKPSKDRWRWR